MCRVGYMTVEYANQVVTNYSRAHIPLETFIVDNQYADGYMDFTFSEGYPQQAFRAFVDGLHAKGQRWVRIHAPCDGALPVCLKGLFSPSPTSWNLAATSCFTACRHQSLTPRSTSSLAIQLMTQELLMGFSSRTSQANPSWVR